MKANRPTLPATGRIPKLCLASMLIITLCFGPVAAYAQNETETAAKDRTIDWQTTVPPTSATNLPRQLANAEQATDSPKLFDCELLPSSGIDDIWLFSPRTLWIGAPDATGSIQAQRCGGETDETLNYSLIDENGDPVEVDNQSDSGTFMHMLAEDALPGTYTLTIDGEDWRLSETFSADAYPGPQLRLVDPNSGEHTQSFENDSHIQINYVNFDAAEDHEVGLYRLGIAHGVDAGLYTLVAVWPLQADTSESPVQEVLQTVDAPGGRYLLIACANACPSRWSGEGIDRPPVVSAAFELNNPERNIEIGYSVLESPIEAVQLGNGPRHVVLIGGLHAGFAPASVEMAEAAITYFEDDFAYSDEITLHIIPNANPDSLEASGKLEGRLNDNGVDLTRNWDCNWRSNAEWEGRPVSGGTAPFSEPESIALRDYLLNFSPVAVIAYEARVPSGQASPGGCGEVSLVSEALADQYSQGTEEAGGAYVSQDFTSYAVNGDAMDWLDAQGIPAITVLLPDFDDPDAETNVTAVEFLLQQIVEQAN